MEITIEIRRKTFDNIVRKLVDNGTLKLGNPVFVNTKVRLAIEETVEREFSKLGELQKYIKSIRDGAPRDPLWEAKYTEDNKLVFEYGID